MPGPLPGRQPRPQPPPPPGPGRPRGQRKEFELQRQYEPGDDTDERLRKAVAILRRDEMREKREEEAA